MRDLAIREGKPSAGGGGRHSEGNMWGEVKETVVSYIFVCYFGSPYKRVDFIRSLLMSLRAYGNAILRMARPLRFTYSGVLYHVTNRGNAARGYPFNAGHCVASIT